LAQENLSFLSIEVRSGLKTETVTSSVRSTLATVDPGLAIALPQSMTTIVAQAVGAPPGVIFYTTIVLLKLG
jgi:hypothetical protein